MSEKLEVSKKATVDSKRSRFPTLKSFLKNYKAIVGLSVLIIFVLVAILAPILAPYDPHNAVGIPWQGPSAEHWFGTTDQGQDVFSQWVLGTRTSMFVGLASGFIATFIAVIIGMFGGFKGGWLDGALNGFTNIMLVIPGFPLILVIASYIPQTGPFAITWIIGLTSWQFSARTKRSQAMTFRNRDFVVAARLSGAPDIWILFHEILPNMLSYVFNNFIWASLAGILAEAGLEFIGIGQPITPSWGNMLNWAQRGDALLNGGWWWFAPPGLSIAIVGLAFTMINFAMDEVTNPRLRKQSKKRKVKSRQPQTPDIQLTVPGEENRA